MGIFDFFANHIAATIVGAVGVISYGLGIAEQAQAIATRFKAWQLQALGAAFFVVAVVMVLAEFEQSRVVAPASVTQTAASNAPGVPPPEPSVLPANIAAEYQALMSRSHTDIQEQRFLKPYAGKSIDLSLEMASFRRDGDFLRGQFYAGENPQVFVTFSLEWEEFLLSKNVGDTIRFRAKIIGDEATGYELGEAAPL